MQRPDDKKRRDILKAAERLFAAHPFHEVKLDDVAARCRIGKGTIYIYFKSKEDLYVSMLREGMNALIADLKARLADSQRSAIDDLGIVIRASVEFAAARPGMFQLMRTILTRQCEQALRESRKAMVDLIRKVIERGVKSGEMADSRPALTAEYLLAAVRGGLLFGGPVSPPKMADHMLHVFGMGLNSRKGSRS
jgi:AcrR family transcriptional regulator